MKLKRTLSLLLSLIMAFSLFAGIAPKAQANDLIGDLLSKYIAKREYVDQIFNDSNCVVKNIPCGAGDQDAKVMYNIYEISGATLANMDFYKQMTAIPDLTTFVADPSETYYAIKIFGSGEMKDYDRLGDGAAPWTATHYNLGNGKEMMPDKQLVLAYVEGEKDLGNGKKFDGVTNVGKCAFFGLDMLTTVFLGDTVNKIDDRAFESTEMLAAINMPSKLNYIGKRAFYGCDKLTFWRARNTQLTEISERAFYGCSLLASVDFPSQLVEIKPMAFAWCRILGDENFTFPSTLKVIGEGAFMFDTHMGRINEINIPSKVDTIGSYAFLCCFGIGKGDNDGLSFTKGSTVPLSIGKYAFAGCRMLQHLKLDNRVANIHTGAFAACERLEDVVFGNDQNAKRVAIDPNAFTSAQSGTVSALDLVSDIMTETGDEASAFVPTANYDSEELEAFGDLTKMTPLRDAAFQNRPASTIKAANDASHSFPKDCVVHYPAASYNPDANTEWLGALDSGKTTWKGYPTKGDWGGHFHDYQVKDSKDATHTQDGYIVYKCSQCSESYTETIKKGHEFEEYNRQEPTCTEPGVVVYHCTREGCSYPNGYYTETIPALGHDEKTVVTVKQPTCTETGLRQGYCSRCNQYINETIPATGHNLSSMTVVEATCTKDGYAYGFCVDCMKTIPKDDPIVLPSKGTEHKWDSGKDTPPATCGKDGVRTYTCSLCGATKTESIAATGKHSWNSGVVTKQPTATETGVRTFTCTVCGMTKTETIPVASHTTHTWDSGVVTKAPKAARTGVRTYTCKVCGKTKTEQIPAIFVDVKADSWYEDAVDWALENSVTNGTDATHFSPNAECTRAQMVTFLWRACGSEPAKNTNNPFTDVTPGKYYYDAVLWAVEKGITTGTTKTTFSPNDKVTRGQTVTFLWRMENEPPASASNPFADVISGKYYYDAVLWAVENEITTGIDATHFAPKSNCTRAQIVTFLCRDLEGA